MSPVPAASTNNKTRGNMQKTSITLASSDSVARLHYLFEIKRCAQKSQDSLTRGVCHGSLPFTSHLSTFLCQKNPRTRNKASTFGELSIHKTMCTCWSIYQAIKVCRTTFLGRNCFELNSGFKTLGLRNIPLPPQPLTNQSR